ncbi:MAG TPA: UrcA family protein, partial [Sphingomonas sp.]|uniref:UrcA family protein n=1 Tax=Sphingomonas sp. TaxID=28214 RepID=UPI002CE898FC
SAESPAQRVVKTSDLNLASADGMQRLNHRILTAIAAVCAPEIQTRLIAGPAERDCRATAGRGAMDQTAAIRQSHRAIQIAGR